MFVLIAPLAAFAGVAALSAVYATGCGGTDTIDESVGADSMVPDTALDGADALVDSAIDTLDTLDTLVALDTGDSTDAKVDALDSSAADVADAADAKVDAPDSSTPDAADALDAADTFDSALPDTSAAHGPAPVLLGSAVDYVMLAKSAISTVPASVITGDLGLSPSASSFVTGFSLTRVGTYWTTPQVIGKVYAADNDAPTPTLLTTAVLDMQTAYVDAAGRPTPDFLNLSTGALGGLVLTPGLYKFTSSVTLGSNVTVSGGPNDTWIFQITGDLTAATSVRVNLLGGAKAKNIVWQVAGMVGLGATSHFEGVVLCKTDITLKTGGSINGRFYAQTAISLDTATVTQPAP